MILYTFITICGSKIDINIFLVIIIINFIWMAMNSHMFFFFRFYNKKRSYDPIDYACIDETGVWIIDKDELGELDLEEMENHLYEEGSLPIEVEGLSSSTQIG